MASSIYVPPSIVTSVDSGAQALQLKSSLTSHLRSLTKPRSPISVTLPSKPILFRGSSIPHCPLMMGIDAACALKQSPRTEETSFIVDSFASQGPAIHEHLQKWLGISGILLGRWRCSKNDYAEDTACSVILPSATDLTQVVLGPQFHCGYPMKYVEIEPKCKFRVKVADDQVDVNFSGHCDGILFIDGKYLVLEIKTKTTSALRDIRSKNLPILEHYHQVNSYRYTIPKYLNISSDLFHDYMVIWYFDRADISNNEPIVVPFNSSVFEREVEAHAVTDYLIKHRMWDKLVGICPNADSRPHCPHNNLCFGSNRKLDLDIVFRGIPDDAT